MSSDKSHISVGIDDDSIRFSLSLHLYVFWSDLWVLQIDTIPLTYCPLIWYFFYVLLVARLSGPPFPLLWLVTNPYFFLLLLLSQKLLPFQVSCHWTQNMRLNIAAPKNKNKKIASKCFSASILDKIKKKTASVDAAIWQSAHKCTFIPLNFSIWLQMSFFGGCAVFIFIVYDINFLVQFQRF